jgi:CubicO group peptidase (beta-lactamase class C family)
MSMSDTGKVEPAMPKTARQLGIMQGFPPPPEKRPTLANWDLPPFNRWTFQNVRSLIPTVDVFRGFGPARVLDEAPEDLGDVRFERENGTTVSVDRFLGESYGDAFLVMHRNRVVFERYLNGMTPETLHLSQSVAKSVVGLLTGVLASDGAVDIHAPLDGHRA